MFPYSAKAHRGPAPPVFLRSFSYDNVVGACPFWIYRISCTVESMYSNKLTLNLLL